MIKDPIRANGTTEEVANKLMQLTFPGSCWLSGAEVTGKAAIPSAGATRQMKAPANGVPTSTQSERGLVHPSQSQKGPNDEAALNVFATAFVPTALQQVNTASGRAYVTPPNRTLDFGLYAQTWLPTSLLPEIPSHCSTGSGAASSSTMACPGLPTPQNYARFFERHLTLEVEAQQLDNNTLALYGHDVSIQVEDPSSWTTTSCNITVPGLGEFRPWLEEDDVIEMRELLYDDCGQFTGAWGQDIVYGRITHVLRPRETVIVKADGLRLGHPLIQRKWVSAQKVQSKFNIQFPVSQERYGPMLHALPVVQQALDMARRVSYEEASHPGQPDRQPPGRRYHGTGPEDNTCWFQSILFPTEVDCEAQDKLNPWVFRDAFFDTQLNREQKQAVESIRMQKYGTLPFLISGPPGTGKTKTIIEVALQIVHSKGKASHILICAPSDPAADTLTERLRPHLRRTELLRLNRQTRGFQEVPGTILPYCCVVNDCFSLPSFSDLMRYKVVVSTCQDTSMLMYGRMTNRDLFAVENGLRTAIHPFDVAEPPPSLHWTALLMDEAAQATEPKAVVPLCVVAPPLDSASGSASPLVIMAGDQHQLGPHSAQADTPLKQSLFARLFARPVYANHPLARGSDGSAPRPLARSMLPILRPAFVNLIRNYRSHPAILAVPSKLFYSDTLEPEAPRADAFRLQDWAWPGWQGSGWPVLFHDVRTEDFPESDGGGWFNPGEAQQARFYAESLVQSGKLKPHEICIMSPFKAQVNLLRRVMRHESREPFDIGPCEAFQGLERPLVILCTTRTRTNFLRQDIQRNWGIIGRPNLMNVALTRAMCGLIVLGKREILSQDEHWSALLDFCDRNGLVTGTDGTFDLDRGQGQVTRLEARLVELSGSGNGRVLGQPPADEDEMWSDQRNHVLPNNTETDEATESDA